MSNINLYTAINAPGGKKTVKQAQLAAQAAKHTKHKKPGQAMAPVPGEKEE